MLKFVFNATAVKIISNAVIYYIRSFDGWLPVVMTVWFV